MADGSRLETEATRANSPTQRLAAGDGARAKTRRGNDSLKRTLLLIAIAAATAGIAYAIVRVTLARPPVDPTTERIQSLIDEANRLLKQLDDKKSS